MGFWPQRPEQVSGELLYLTPFGPEGVFGAGLVPGGMGAGAWVAANKALYVPVRFEHPLRVTRLFVHNGTPSGNVDLGVYDRTWRRLAHTGSTAGSGSSALQLVALGAPLDLDGELYYLACAWDNTTATVNRSNVSTVAFLQAAGCAEEASAFPLPATATPVAITAGYLPNFGCAVRQAP